MLLCSTGVLSWLFEVKLADLLRFILIWNILPASRHILSLVMVKNRPTHQLPWRWTDVDVWISCNTFRKDQNHHKFDICNVRRKEDKLRSHRTSWMCEFSTRSNGVSRQEIFNLKMLVMSNHIIVFNTVINTIITTINTVMITVVTIINLVINVLVIVLVCWRLCWRLSEEVKTVCLFNGQLVSPSWHKKSEEAWLRSRTDKIIGCVSRFCSYSVAVWFCMW
jgi:hypothetical protein